MRVTLVIGLLVLAACGSHDESTTIAGTTYTMSNGGDTATVDGAKGKLSASQGTAAANTEMPDFAPQYPGSTITNSIASEREGRPGLMVLMTAHDTPADAAAFYRSSLESAGFDVPKGMRTEDAEIFTGTRNGQKVSITTSRDEAATNIVVSISAT